MCMKIAIRASGDRRIDELILKYQPVANHAYQRFAREYPGLADDFESDARCEVWQLAERSITGGPPMTDGLVFTAVTRNCQDRLRAEQRCNQTALRSRGGPGSGAGERLSALDLIESRDGSEQSLDIDDLLASLLSPADRALVRGNVMEGRPLYEVADDVGVSPKTARKRIDSALAILRAALKEGETSRATTRRAA
jgi:RNA polymerase sigma factor (sigma-70 family)